MNLIVFAVLGFLLFSMAKPIPDRLDYITKVFKTHYGNFDNFKNVSVPPLPDISESSDENPYLFQNTNDGTGNYQFQFGTFGLRRSEVGELKNKGTDNEIQAVRGQYLIRFVNEDGVDVVRTIGYIADENGYRPFLIDMGFVLSQAIPAPGGPTGTKRISSAALGSLIGGNPIG